MKILISKRWPKIKYVFLLLGLIIFFSGIDYYYYHQKLYPGMNIKGIYLGNKTLLEAETMIDNLHLTFVGAEGETRTMPLKDMGIEPITGEIISQSYQKGRARSWPFNYLERLRISRGTAVPFKYKIHREKFHQQVDRLAAVFQKIPEDACYEIIDENAVIRPEKYGYQVYKEKLVTKIMDNLEQEESPLVVPVPGEILSPVFTSSHFEEMGILEQMASYTTLFDASYETRAHNIDLAASTLNEQLIGPGEIFSFNGVIGDTTPAKGYKEALVIQGSEYVTGYGGGVCQVSTTLYNAALLSNLPVVERHNHQFMAPYVLAGRDAAVSYGVYDLKFRNNRDHYILIVTRVENGKITMALAGYDTGEEVEINTHYLEYIEPSLRIEVTPQLPPGEQEKIEGKPGGTVEAWRIVHRAGGEKREEKLSVDSYQPYPAVLRRGKTSP